MGTRHRFALAAALVTALAGVALAGAPAGLGPTPDEAKDDRDFYQRQIENRNILSATSSQQRTVNALGSRINAIAAPVYGTRFIFLATKEQEVNAAAYAPHVYVNDGLIRYVHNADELAAVLCHEVSHAILHHGQYGMLRDARLASKSDSAAARAMKILHGHLQGLVQSAASTGELLAMMHYSRNDEEQADLKGSEICARAHYNPWGAVWLFQTMAIDSQGVKASRWMADHPDLKHRIAQLKKHFKKNKVLFASYRNDPSTATPLQ